jgi:hypothetical protein
MRTRKGEQLGYFRRRAYLGLHCSEETGNGREKVGKGRRGKREEQRGEGGIYGGRESSEARAHAPSPIGRPLNPGGQTPRLRLLTLISLPNII